jgi:hypothetical protein
VTPEQLASLYADDSLAPATTHAITSIGCMHDEFAVDASSPVAYTTFIEQSHLFIRLIQHTIPEHEIFLVQDIHHDLLHDAFAQHFKNTQNS